MLYYAQSSKDFRMPTKGRSTRLLDRASSWVCRANKQNVSSSYLQPAQPGLSIERASIWSSRPSDIPRMLFLTLQVLGAVSMLLIHNFNVLNVDQCDLPYKQRAHLFIQTSSNTNRKPKHIAIALSYISCNTSL